MAFDEAAARAWLARKGFADGDVRNRDCVSFRCCPMACACDEGLLGMCKWLYDNGAAADVTTMDVGGRTPLVFACRKGHLNVCTCYSFIRHCRWRDAKSGRGERALKGTKKHVFQTGNRKRSYTRRNNPRDRDMVYIWLL